MIRDDDLIAGWRYSATFQLRTPLKYLEMHGTFSPESEQPALVGPAENSLEDGTGFNAYGIWLREIDYEALGFDPPRPGMRAAQGGMVEIGGTEEKELLSFLKSFRYIVETGETLDQMLFELEELSISSPGNRRMWARFTTGSSPLPHSYFIEQLWMKLPKGVGEFKARKFYLAGFRTIEEIQAASDEQLLQIPGIGKGMLKKIRGCAVQQDC